MIIVWLTIVVTSFFSTSVHPTGSVWDLRPIVADDFLRVGNKKQVELGRLLFFDKILSGNKDISCSSCHHPSQGLSDGLPLGLGTGAEGIGKKRRIVHSVLGRVPRNSPTLWDLSTTNTKSLLYDGRVEVDSNGWGGGFWTPAREQTPTGLNSVLAAQALMPMVSEVEMAGYKSQNSVATAVSLDRLTEAWKIIATRVSGINEYVRMFCDAFADINKPSDITIVHIVNAIAAFEGETFRSGQSLFDKFIETKNESLLPKSAITGMNLFFGKAKCNTCHSGKFFTDNRFHSIGMIQIGPGKNDGSNDDYWSASGFSWRVEDFGRAAVSFDPSDRYKFKTPSLRNLKSTAPYGHAGAFRSLRGVVRHHVSKTGKYMIDREVELPSLNRIMEVTARGSSLVARPMNPKRIQDFLRRDNWVIKSRNLSKTIMESSEIDEINLSENEIEAIVAFLETLNEPELSDNLKPATVPSNINVD